VTVRSSERGRACSCHEACAEIYKASCRNSVGNGNGIEHRYMQAIGATLTSGGGTLLICVHQFTVAFGARDDTRQRASVSFVCPIAHAPCCRCTLLALSWRVAAIARGVRS